MYPIYTWDFDIFFESFGTQFLIPFTKYGSVRTRKGTATKPTKEKSDGYE